jgi:hypothetical protein
MMVRYRAAAPYLILLVIAAAVCVTASHQARLIALADDDIVVTFYSLTGGLEEYKEVRQEWRGRILSNALAGALVNASESRHGFAGPTEAMPYVASMWTLGWLFGICALFIVAFRARALLYIFGIFAAVSFAYTPGIGWALLTPYELPALLVFSSFVVLVATRRLEWLLVLVPVGVLFKESAIILPAAFLLWDGVSVRRRIAFAVGAVALAVVAKLIVDLVTNNPSPLFTMTADYSPRVARYEDNIRRLLDTSDLTTHPLFVNAGLVVALLLVPLADPRILMLKVIGGLFIVGNFLFGLITEHRIWFELIPVSLYAVDLALLRSAGRVDDPVAVRGIA